MPHVITQSCCSDGSCALACPVNCIHPSPDEPDFLTAEMLHIDPQACVDCGACVLACPVDAIIPAHRLPESQKAFAGINAAYYDGLELPLLPTYEQRVPLAPARIPVALGLPRRRKLSVGIIGSGPAAMYAADELLRHREISVTMYEKLDTPYGLARFGVAPDHRRTRKVSRLFDRIRADSRLTLRTNITVGKDISVDQLRAKHSSIVVACGAATDRKIGIPGEAEHMATARNFVAWYNDHPEHRNDHFDLSHDKAVIVGNGNVALDAARILAMDPEELADTDISRIALAALRASKIREVIIVGRRGPAQSAFTLPELVGLAETGLLRIDPAELDRIGEYDHDDVVLRQKLELLRKVSKLPAPTGKSIWLRYFLTPKEASEGRLKFTDTTLGEEVSIDAGVLLSAVGYRGAPLPGLPFDDARAVIPNTKGRVTGMPDVYAVGWIKRGPSGFLGTNKSDAIETIDAFRADVIASR